MHPDGYVKIKDRSKDIIISGGENISSIEVEDVLYRHPAVMPAAVVAVPDEKWGEVPCAFVELKDGAPSIITAEDIIATAASTWRASRCPSASSSAGAAQDLDRQDPDPPGLHPRADRPQRRGQDHLLQPADQVPEPTRGQILFNGHDITREQAGADRAPRRDPLVPDLGGVPHLTCWRTCAWAAAQAGHLLPLLAQRAQLNQLDDRAMELLTEVGLATWPMKSR
jgi:hypothetical protein